MSSNLEKYQKDLDSLIDLGRRLLFALQFECFPDELERTKKAIKDKRKAEALTLLPKFSSKYQAWYSEALVLVKLLLPDRLNDFIRLYEKPKNRKDITFENYVIEDCLQGLVVTRGWEKVNVVNKEAAIPRFEQQLNIVESIKARFMSSIFDIKRLVQADLFDSELDAARVLNKAGFFRGAGAMAGVVLEAHLAQVCETHQISIVKKDPTINHLNDLLKDNSVVEIPNWRFIQHLADIRNLCDHDKKREPSAEEIEELIKGVEKVTKTLF